MPTALTAPWAPTFWHGWPSWPAPRCRLAAVGAAALVNPVIGAAALVANTVLQKPLNRLFSYRYHVTGTWADPKVDKAGESVQELQPKQDDESTPGENKP